MKFSFVCYLAPQIPDSLAVNSTWPELVFLGSFPCAVDRVPSSRKPGHHLACFPLLRNYTLHVHVLHVIQCLMTVASYILPSFTVVYMREVSLI